MNLQTVAHVIQSDAPRHLSIEHGNDMTPRRKAACFFLSTSFVGKFFDQMAWNEVANLTEGSDLATAWFSFFGFHPC